MRSHDSFQSCETSEMFQHTQESGWQSMSCHKKKKKKLKNHPATLSTYGRLPRKREQAAGHKHCNSKPEASKKPLSPVFT